MLWLPIAVGSYFLSGLASVIDKILLEKRIPDPLVLTFYTGISSIGVAFLAFFGNNFLAYSYDAILLAFGVGALFVVAFYFLYSALEVCDASRVMPIIGGASPFFILTLEVLLAGAVFEIGDLAAFLLLVAGGILLSIDRKRKKAPLNIKMIGYALIAAVFFAAMFFWTDVVYARGPFLEGFIMIRFGSFLAALLLFTLPALRRRIRRGSAKASNSSKGLFLLNKGIGASSFIVLNFAIKLGPVSIVNALRGLEYLFIFLIAMYMTHAFPHVLHEKFDSATLVTKLGGAFVVGAGVLVLALT